MELGASMIASLKLEAEGAKQGALQRAQYVASALTTKEQWAAAHADVKQQISALQPTVDALRGEYCQQLLTSAVPYAWSPMASVGRYGKHTLIVRAVCILGWF
jgi:ABC-type hemin transport system substrate-binding protein